MPGLKIHEYVDIDNITGSEYILTDDGTKYRKTSINDIKNIADDISNAESASLEGKTAGAQDVKNIINNINTSLENHSNSIADVTASLLENTQNIANLGTTKAPLASPNFTGTPTILTKTVATTETTLLTPSNGWINNVTEQLLKAVKNGNLVTVTGRISGGTTTSGIVIATLPSGFRPSTGKPWTGIQNKAIVIGDITTSGDIRIWDTITTDTLYINFSFYIS